MGNIAIKTAGKRLGISEITSCDSFAMYVTTKFSMTKFEACDSTIDKLLESIPGDNEDKNYLINMMKKWNIDPNTIKINEHCLCAC